MSAQLVKVRLMGPSTAVAHAADEVRRVLTVVGESREYPNRPPSTDVRQYLDVLIDSGDRGADLSRHA
jgi:hypothetical protein